MEQTDCVNLLIFASVLFLQYLRGRSFCDFETPRIRYVNVYLTSIKHKESVPGIRNAANKRRFTVLQNI